MSEINYDELQDAVIKIEDEDGSSIECSMQCVFECDGQDFAVFAEEENPNNEVYFFALDGKKVKGKMEIELSLIDDDELLEQLLEIFQQLVDNELNEDASLEDPDEEVEEEPGEDDHIWDEFITKKLED